MANRVGRRVARWAASTASAPGMDVPIGDEPLAPHPDAPFGRFMTMGERCVWQDRRGEGVGFAAGELAGGAAAGPLLDLSPRGAVAAASTALASRFLGATASRASRE